MNPFVYTLGFGEKWISFHSLNIVWCIWIRCQHFQLWRVIPWVFLQAESEWKNRHHDFCATSFKWHSQSLKHKDNFGGNICRLIPRQGTCIIKITDTIISIVPSMLLYIKFLAITLIALSLPFFLWTSQETRWNKIPHFRIHSHGYHHLLLHLPGLIHIHDSGPI